MINLEHLKIRLNESLNKKIDYNKLLLNNLKNSFVLKNPMLLYENKKQNIDLYFEKLNNMMNYRLERTNTKFSNLINKLELLNPLSVLSKGYSVTYKDDKVIKDASKLKKNDSVTIRLYNGLFEAKVEEIKK